MKSIVCFILTLNFSLCAFGQNFTNGSVFNYAIGDTIVTEYNDYYNGYNTSIPLKYRQYMAITGKTICPTGDTIIYKSFNSRENYLSFQPLTTSVTTTVDTFTITNLLSSLINYSLQGDACQLQRDTTSLDCGVMQHIKELDLNPDSICFEPPILRHTVIEGVGTFTLSRSNSSYPYLGMGYETKLLSFSKGATKCGVIGKMPTGIETQESQVSQFEVFPNPVVGIVLELKTSEEALVEIYTVEGRSILLQSIAAGLTSIDVSGFKNGIYFLRYSNGNRNAYKKIIIEHAN